MVIWILLTVIVGIVCLFIAVIAGPIFAGLFNTSLAVGYIIYIIIAALTITVALKIINTASKT